MHLSKLDDLEPFTTLDGSTIREIAGPAWTPARNQSLAEATVPVGARDGRALPPRHRGAVLLHGRQRAHDARRRGARGRAPATASSSRPGGPRSRQHRRRAARPAVLLRAGLLPRGHRPGNRSGSRRVVPAPRCRAASSTLLVVLLAALCAASSPQRAHDRHRRPEARHVHATRASWPATCTTPAARCPGTRSRAPRRRAAARRVARGARAPRGVNPLLSFTHSSDEPSPAADPRAPALRVPPASARAIRG